MSRIRLQSVEGKIFNTDITTAKFSMTVKTMLATCWGDTDNKGVIPLYNVDACTLSKVLEWASYHKRNFQEDSTIEPICAWEENYLNGMSRAMLFEVMMAANYLDIQRLLDQTCKAIADLISGKTPEEIREFFNVTDDRDNDAQYRDMPLAPSDNDDYIEEIPSNEQRLQRLYSLERDANGDNDEAAPAADAPVGVANANGNAVPDAVPDAVAEAAPVAGAAAVEAPDEVTD